MPIELAPTSAADSAMPVHPDDETFDPLQMGPPVFVAAPAPTIDAKPAPVRLVELGALVALVALADLALYWGTGGLGDAVLMTAGACILYVAAPARRISVRLCIMAALVAALAARSVWHGAAGTLLLGLSGVFGIGIALRTRRSYIPEVWASGLSSAVGAFGQLRAYLAGVFRLVSGGRLRRVRWAAVLVPILVVVIFALVFMAANPLLERWAGLAWDALTGGSGSFFTPARVVLWLAAALVASGFLVPRVRELRLAERLGPGHVLAADLAPPEDASVAIARNVLVGVNVLFFAYNALDGVYLWAGTPPPGIDHTRYAHDGTTWLTISLLMSTVVLGFVFRGAMNARTEATRAVRFLGLAWAAQNIVLAAGTFRRIEMYVADSGLTELRCLGIAGVVVVAAAFGLIIEKVRGRHTSLWLLRSQFDVFVMALVLWTVLPIDTIVWSFNASRIEAGQDRPLLHIFKQGISAEGVPALATLLDHPDPQVAKGVASRLLAIRQDLLREERGARRWTQKEMSRSRALLRIEDEMPRILELVPDNQSSAIAFQELRTRAFEACGQDPNITWEAWEY